MDRKSFIQSLTNLGERQLEVETVAAEMIQKVLRENNIVFSTQEFSTDIPVYTHCSLYADGVSLDVLPSGFVSGTVINNHTLLSSLISSQKNLYDANINFNPACSSISRSNFYFAPAFSIARDDVQKVVSAKNIEGKLEVVKTPHTSKNILVGNTTNPKILIFSHYDSISTGAIDNASGTTLSLELILEEPELLKSTLFVLAGNEELSYDETIYWGHGYRCFERAYPELIQNSSHIIVLDSFGHTAPVVFSDLKILTLAFPLSNISQYAEKTCVIAGDIDSLMEVYHADNDVPENIIEEYFLEAKQLVLEFVRKQNQIF